MSKTAFVVRASQLSGMVFSNAGDLSQVLFVVSNISRDDFMIDLQE
jgi:hypothetical protein